MLHNYGDKRYNFGFKEEKTRVPLVTLSEGGFYGVEYSAPDGFEYTVQVTAVVPNGVRAHGDVLYVHDGPGVKTIVFNHVGFTGSAVQPFLFSKGDPAGLYILGIQVIGQDPVFVEYEAYVPDSKQ